MRSRLLLLFSFLAMMLTACFAGYRTAASCLRVRRGTFVHDVVLTGELESARGDLIAVPALPQWQTTIKWLTTDGVEAKQGDKIVELDNTAFVSDLDAKRQAETQAAQELQQKEGEWAADLKEKQLDVEKKKSELEKAKLEAGLPREILAAREYEDRQTKLRRAQVEYDKSVDVLKSQRTGISSERANLDLKLLKAHRDITIAQTAIDALILRAPRDGIVVIKDIPWEGRKLQAGDAVFVGFPLAVIPEMSTLQVAASLADVDDGRVAIGMPAVVTLDGYPDMTFPGRVESISAVAQESNRQSLRRAFKVVVKLARIDAERMRPGLSARVTIRRQQTADALIAPRVALDLSGDKPSALLGNGKRKEVAVSSCNAQDCVVTNGLEEGQTLASLENETHG
ncbi:MAG: HlyD family efflux transporter periplasmic adaptor subunit [Acidobacteria bacterium]|nr:HlyD family efflux transporter periplasmic adaptor subunit [Acidobacteriota bacterium]